MLLQCFFLKKSPQTHSGKNVSPALPEGICREFSLAEIKASTKNFHRDLIIGRGSFGKVFKGSVDDETIAVKRFDNKITHRGFENFRREVELLCQLRHPHLVSLIGFCVDQTALILVYEYVSRGSLYHHLYNKDNKDYVPLDWKRRLQICIGAARGLHYLHSGAKRALVHRDIKSADILMSKALIRIESDVRGTMGYLDPEYLRTKYLSEKSDVYSFGVVLLECIENETIYNIIDPHLKGSIAPDCFKQFVDIALSCLKDSGDDRPSMGEVEMTLELALQLQNKADSEIEHINPHGGCVYEDVLFYAPHVIYAVG
ncbi:hypothetical protein COLO4_03900 [Corchorus olitorius]|uniref:Protein kinase domain-containing protein n=1 Tax=Corchorus olitorius TaxID=93759 RepID=A0A1R3KWC4_9ROSI|nr:hypothetical protein COLO4_03900 [Corchorus olitorius]